MHLKPKVQVTGSLAGLGTRDTNDALLFSTNSLLQLQGKPSHRGTAEGALGSASHTAEDAAQDFKPVAACRGEVCSQVCIGNSQH